MYMGQNGEHVRRLTAPDQSCTLVPEKTQNYLDFGPDLLVDPFSGFVVLNGCKAENVHIISKAKKQDRY